MAPVVLHSKPSPFRAAIKANGKSKPTIRNPPAMVNSAPPSQVQNRLVRPSFAFDSMEDALAAFTRGEFVVVMDDENRENEGDLIIAASLCTTEKMAWMIKHTRYAQMSGISSCLLNFLNQWVHLRRTPWRALGPTGHTSDVPCKPGTTPNGLYSHS
jgi:hypothetical protein